MRLKFKVFQKSILPGRQLIELGVKLVSPNFKPCVFLGIPSTGCDSDANPVINLLHLHSSLGKSVFSSCRISTARRKNLTCFRLVRCHLPNSRKASPTYRI